LTGGIGVAASSWVSCRGVFKLQRRVHGSRNRPKRVLLFAVSRTWSRSLSRPTNRCWILPLVTNGPAYISSKRCAEKARYSLRDKLATKSVHLSTARGFDLWLEAYTARVCMVRPGEPSLSTLFRPSLHIETALDRQVLSLIHVDRTLGG
jgi:hypothetical protein